MSIKEKVLMKGEGVMNLFNVHKQRECEMERRVVMISDGVNVYKLLKDLLWIAHILLENRGQTASVCAVPFKQTNKQTKKMTHPLWNSGHCSKPQSSIIF